MSVEISKAGALFNFLLQRFELSKKVGDLKYLDIVEIVDFIEAYEKEHNKGE